MHLGTYVFSRVMNTIVRYEFNQCVTRYQGEYWMKRFSCWEQFLAMTFGQLAYRESLRDVVVCLNAQRNKSRFPETLLEQGDEGGRRAV